MLLSLHQPSGFELIAILLPLSPKGSMFSRLFLRQNLRQPSLTVPAEVDPELLIFLPLSLRGGRGRKREKEGWGAEAEGHPGQCPVTEGKGSRHFRKEVVTPSMSPSSRVTLMTSGRAGS